MPCIVCSGEASPAAVGKVEVVSCSDGKGEAGPTASGNVCDGEAASVADGTGEAVPVVDGRDEAAPVVDGKSETDGDGRGEAVPVADGGCAAGSGATTRLSVDNASAMSWSAACVAWSTVSCGAHGACGSGTSKTRP